MGPQVTAIWTPSFGEANRAESRRNKPPGGAGADNSRGSCFTQNTHTTGILEGSFYKSEYFVWSKIYVECLTFFCTYV